MAVPGLDSMLGASSGSDSTSTLVTVPGLDSTAPGASPGLSSAVKLNKHRPELGLLVSYAYHSQMISSSTVMLDMVFTAPKTSTFCQRCSMYSRW